MILNQANTSIIKRLLGGRNSRPLRSILKKIDPADLSRIFNQLNEREIKLLIDALMALDKAGSTLKELPAQQLNQILSSLETNKLIALLTYSGDSESSYFLSCFEHEKQEAVLSLLDPTLKKRLEQFLSFPEDSAGRIMHSNVFSAPASITCQEGIELLRKKSEDIPVYYVYCLDQEDKLVGVISLRQLASSPADTPLSQLLKREIISVKPESEAMEAAKLVSQYDLVAIPVVNDQMKLLGVIPVDHVIDLIQEQATSSIYASAGLQEDDKVFSPALFSIKSRLPWMVLNLFMATAVSSVVSLFEDTMSQIILLASLNSLVSAMGGNMAVQAATVVTRGLATGDFGFTTIRKVFSKEIMVGVINGMICGVVTGILIYSWKHNLGVAFVIFISMVINSIWAALLGVWMPLLLKKFNWDPAVASTVVITVLTDTFGFSSFLGIATIGIKYFGLAGH